MKYYKKLFTLIIAINASMISSAYAEILRGVHITATGNNSYECKIRANADGMKQAMSLIADDMGIKNAFFKNIPYEELKAVFAVDSVITEKSFDEKYTADVNYYYTTMGVHQLILQYSTNDIKSQFFDYVVIPVLKQKEKIAFLDARTEWLSTWMDSSEECIKNKLLPLDPTKNATNITTANIFSKSYSDFLNDLKIKRFENVLIAICEYFTRDDGTMYFKVTTQELTPFSKNITEAKYDITTPDNARKYFAPAIRRIIAQYGKQTTYNLNDKDESNRMSYTSAKMKVKTDGSKKGGGVLDALLARPKVGTKLMKVDMRLDIFSVADLEHIKAKLHEVKEIAKFQIDLDDEKNYKITLYIRGSLENLAEGFYTHNLSYKFYDEEYVMFELESGI